MKKVVILCSGGIDSIVLAYALAKDHTIQPLYVQFRVGGGKAGNEIRTLDKFKHTNILDPVILRGKEFRIPKETYDTRNVQLLKIAEDWIFRTSFLNDGFSAIAIGTYPQRDMTTFANIPDEETKKEHLEKFIDLPLITLDDFNCNSKLDIVNLGYDVVGDKLFETTSSQSFYGYECGRCFSCVERHAAFMLSKYKEDKTTYKRNPQESKRYKTYKTEMEIK